MSWRHRPTGRSSSLAATLANASEAQKLERLERLGSTRPPRGGGRRLTRRRAALPLGIVAISLVLGVTGAGASHGVSAQVSQGAINGNGENCAFCAAFFLAASADGSRVFFQSNEMLADTDTDTAIDVYERAGGVTSQISQGTINGNSNLTVSFLDASADGTRVVFGTFEQLVTADTDGALDFYERSAGETALISGGSDNVNPEYAGSSVDGTRVLFKTKEPLSPGDTDLDVDIYQRFEGRLALLTPTGRGTQEGLAGSEDALYGGISDDGRHLFWTTFEEVLASDDEETGASLDVYETFNGTTSHVSIGSNAPRGAIWAGNSADGARVFFHTSESYDSAGDTDAQSDIYERAAGGTKLVSRGTINGNGAHAAVFVGASADGSRVLFRTSEALVGTDTDGAQDLYERVAGTTLHASQGAINGNGPDWVLYDGASVDGAHVVFTTVEKLAVTDTDSSGDIYERVDGNTVHVSQGEVNGNGANQAAYVGMSADGNRVFFTTTERLAATDTDDSVDVYERSGDVTSHVSGGSQSGDSAGFVLFPRVSLDGSHVFFSTLDRLAASDTDDQWDVYEAAEITDSDGDGIGDNGDNCPTTANPDQADGDADGIGDACDNRAPTAADDAYAHHGTDTALEVPAPGVLDDDGDGDGDPLSALLVDAPSHGTLTLDPDGSFTYEPSEDFLGDDAFTYVASDGQSTSEPTTVILTIGAGCEGLAATIVGTDAPEGLHGTAGADVIAGLGGDDKINGAGGSDVICGGLGDDDLNADAGADHVLGGSGDDTLRGDLGDDTIFGEGGADTLLGDGGNDWLRGGDGSPDTCRGGAGIDLLAPEHGCEHFTGVP